MNRALAAGIAAAALLAMSAGTTLADPDVLGSWGPDESCAADGRRMVMTAQTIELKAGDVAVFRGRVEYSRDGREVTVKVVEVFETTDDPSLPRLGDAQIVYREGDQLMPVALQVAATGERIDLSGFDPMYPCD